MLKINTFKITTFFLIMIFFITSCTTVKLEYGKVRERNIKLNFNNCCLATNIKGSGKIKVYDKALIVRIKKGSIKINPEFDNKTYTVGDIYMSLGKYVNKEKGSWDLFNKSQKKTLDLTIDSLDDSIDLSGMVFEIPYNNNSELENSWIVITTTDETRKGTNYSHSIDKKKKFEK